MCPLVEEVDRTAADEPVLHRGGELIASGIVREDHLELLEGFGVIRGDADVLDAARDALDVIQRVSGGGGSLGLLLAILRGLDLDAVRAEPRLLLLGGVQLFILSDWGVVAGHPGLRFVADGVTVGCDAVGDSRSREDRPKLLKNSIFYKMPRRQPLTSRTAAP